VIQSWEHLNDWPLLLLESKKYISLVSPKKTISTLMGDAPQHLKLLVSITQRQTMSRHIKVLTNIEIAALNLHIMWKVCRALFPDLQRLRSHNFSRETWIYLTTWTGLLWRQILRQILSSLLNAGNSSKDRLMCGPTASAFRYS
jgi:hypothetical protein